MKIGDKSAEKVLAGKKHRKTCLLSKRLRIDACTSCNLSCPACVRTVEGSRAVFFKNIGQGFLSCSRFKTIVQRNPWVESVELSNWGEIFLNPDLQEIMQFAYQNNIVLSANNGVNFNEVSSDVLKDLVKYQFRSLTFSLDGADNAVYQLYRRGGDFNKVLSNVKTLCAIKKECSSEYPRLVWQFIVFGHNEHQIAEARELASQLGMEFIATRNSQNWDPEFSPVCDSEYVKKETGWDVATGKEFLRKHKKNMVMPCSQLWKTPQVNWDGRLLGCCMNIYSDFGSALDTSLKVLIASERYEYAKKMVMGESPPREDIPCSYCVVYKTSQKPLIDRGEMEKLYS